MTLQQRSALLDDARQDVTRKAEPAPTSGRENAQEQAEAMSRVNQRRIELIKRKALSPAEEQELEALQAEVNAFVDEKYPLPFAALERMEGFAQNLQQNLQQKLQDRDPK